MTSVEPAPSPPPASARPPIADARPPVPPPGAGGRPPRRGGLSIRTFESFSIRAYRWYFIAMLGHMSGMNMQMVARSWLVFHLTGSFALLGVMALANALPGMALSMVGGAVADRVPQKKHVVQAGQFVNALNALAIAVLLATDLIRFEHLVVAGFVQGAVNAIMMPARQALINELVDRDHLMNAIALNSSGMNTMRLFAPALGGLLLSIWNPAVVYFLMAGMYLFASVMFLKVPRSRVERPARGSVRNEVRQAIGNIADGVRYMRHHATIGIFLLVNVLIVISAMPYMFMLAGFVESELHEGPDKLGLLQSVVGFGSLAGSLTIASVRWKHQGRIFLLASALQGVALLTAFTLAESFLWMAPIMFVMGLGQSGRQALSQVIVQSQVDDAYRGRVMSVYMLQFSLSSFGTFFAGLLAAAIGVRAALGLTSMLLIAVALGALLFIPRVRDIR